MKNIKVEVFCTPAQVAARWGWHAESVRRKIRGGEIASLIIGRRRLIRLQEIERIEAEAEVTPATLKKAKLASTELTESK